MEDIKVGVPEGSGTVRSLRHPQTGVAGALADLAVRCDARIVAAYLVPPDPQPVELMAAAGVAAASLGPPGKVSERHSGLIRALALEVSVSDAPGALGSTQPWGELGHIRAISTLLGDRTSCVLVAGGDAPPCPDNLTAASSSVGMLVQAIEQGRRVAELQAQIRQLEEERSLVASTLQHDLKTPLTSILGFASTLRQHGDSLSIATRNESLEGIIRQAERLNRMINETATRERGGPGRPLRLRLTQVCDLLSRISATVGGDHANEVIIECDRDLAIVTDADRLERALLNLVDNALKYSPDDTPVHVIVESRADTMVFTVADSGPGVSPEVLPGLFGAYATDPSRSDGTGLGLHSARRIADELGGRVDYSRAQDWTRFSLTVPRERNL